ncbi:hypothetical protein ACFL6I_22530, partial [candidate division KSB1 bacterium]
MFEFAKMWRVLPDTWQSRTITRVSRSIMNLTQKDAKLMKKLEEAEGKGSIEKVEKIIEKAAKEEILELKKIETIGIQTEVLELHETQRLGNLNRELARIGGKVGIDKVRLLIE